jgi:hypothetical protein
MRIEPEDDYLHPAEDASNFNESRYYSVYDPASGLGGWVRMGNRPNEGYAEMTVCLYLPPRADDFTGPDGTPRPRVAFMYKRPTIKGHEAHDAGGLRFEVVELRSDYDDEWFPRSVNVTVTTDDETYEIEGTPWSAIPLRNRRNGLTTRISESMTHWRCGERTGAGLSEYLDQIIDDVPVGTRDGI